MRPPDDPEVAAWLAKAKGDMRMARAAAEMDDPLWDQACFHAQQAAEKALKSLLVAFNKNVPHSHDLLLLLRSLASRLPELEALEPQTALLSQYGVAPRYPSFLAPHTEEDAGAALSCAWAITAVVDEAFRSFEE